MEIAGTRRITYDERWGAGTNEGYMGEERLTLVDFNEAQRVIKGYGGNAGRKAAVLWEGSLWMVKFPESTAGMRGNILSDTTSPVAEYIGSHVFEQIGVPVHRTVLGTLEGKVVVACRDLEWESSKRLVTFHDIKNADDSGRLLPDGTASSGAALFLSDIGAFLRSSTLIGDHDEVIRRFWDMFVVDALIGNGERNNEKWGFLQAPPFGALELAPVYDNGNAMFNKRRPETTELDLGDERRMRSLALGAKSVFLRDDGHHVKPLDCIVAAADLDCNAAIRRIVPRIDLSALASPIDSIPREAYDMPMMSTVVARFHKEIFRIRLEEGLLPALEVAQR